ncbi:MAG: hypothetical protein DRQ02_01315 [Candidatus Latescibacterota bacterium]|nr:MAG: hypothetical protein DRQ02_01315 [Candidatus Latescibacterota bacterium]
MLEKVSGRYTFRDKDGHMHWVSDEIQEAIETGLLISRKEGDDIPPAIVKMVERRMAIVEEKQAGRKADRPNLLKLACFECGWVRWIRKFDWMRGHGKRCRSCRTHTMKVVKWGWEREEARIIDFHPCPFCYSGRRPLLDDDTVGPCANCGDDAMTKKQLETYL